MNNENTISDLFHKAILQSGSIQYTWVITKNPKKYAYQMCTMLGKYNDDPVEMFKFINTLDTRKLTQLQDKLRRTTVSMITIVNVRTRGRNLLLFFFVRINFIVCLSSPWESMINHQTQLCLFIPTS